MYSGNPCYCTGDTPSLFPNIQCIPNVQRCPDRPSQDHSIERPPDPGQREPGTRRLDREGPHASRRTFSHGPGDLDAAKEQPTPQDGFGALGYGDWAPEARQAELPSRGTSRSYDQVARKPKAQWRFRGFKRGCGTRTAASPSPHPRAEFCRTVSAKRGAALH